MVCFFHVWKLAREGWWGELVTAVYLNTYNRALHVNCMKTCSVYSFSSLFQTIIETDYVFERERDTG